MMVNHPGKGSLRSLHNVALPGSSRNGGRGGVSNLGDVVRPFQWHLHAKAKSSGDEGPCSQISSAKAELDYGEEEGL